MDSDHILEAFSTMPIDWTKKHNKFPAHENSRPRLIAVKLFC